MSKTRMKLLFGWPTSLVAVACYSPTTVNLQRGAELRLVKSSRTWKIGHEAIRLGIGLELPHGSTQ